MSKRKTDDRVLGYQNHRARRPAQEEDQAPSPLLDIELEAEIIGAVLDDNTNFSTCAFLAPEHFTDPIHAELWEHMLYLRQAGKDATLSTLAIDLGESRLQSIGGRDYLATLAIRGLKIKTSLIEATERLKDLAQWRLCKALAQDIIQWSENQETSMTSDEAISTTIQELKNVLAAGGSRARRKSEVAKAAIKQLAEGREPDATLVGHLDFLLHGGLLARRTYALVGYFGRGKTILLGTISANLNAQGINHLFISLETPDEDIETRSLARDLDLNAAQLHDRDDPLWKDYINRASANADSIKDHTWFEYAPGASIDEIERMIIRAIHLYDIKGAIIDYWQMIEGKPRNQNTAEFLKDVAKRLANLARRENIWILMTAQGDENGETRECKTGLHEKFTMVIRLVRGENDDTAYFETTKSNHTRYASTEDASGPTIIFDMAGPHFRAARPQDHSQYAEASSD